MDPKYTPYNETKLGQFCLNFRCVNFKTNQQELTYYFRERCDNTNFINTMIH